MVSAQVFTIEVLKNNVIEYVRKQCKPLLGFVLANFLWLLLITIGLRGIGTLWFLLWGVGYYIFNFIFFRFVFNRKPYLFTNKFFDTLLPAAKMLALVMLFLTLLAHLPYIPLLLGETSEQVKLVITNFIEGFMGDSNVYNVVVSLILLLCSPFLLYRPFMAWLSAVIGRSGSFKNAFKHTKGRYKMFLLILATFYLFVCGVQLLDMGLHLNGWLLSIVVSPLTILVNVVMAKTYEALFLN